MSKMEELEKGLFRLTVPLEGSPLKEIHPYLIAGETRNLLIDTAFNTDQCEKALLEEMRAAGAAPDNTDIFLTHMHVDHSGLAARLKRESNRIFISGEDQKLLNGFQSKQHWDWVCKSNEWTGTPVEYALRPHQHIAWLKRPSGLVSTVEVKEGEQLRYGDFTLETVGLSGHTPGHLGLWDKDRRILFGGDHLLEGISPNIAAWDLERDYVRDYCENLIKLGKMDLARVYPSHRRTLTAADERAAECLGHHEKRFSEIVKILTSEGRPVSAFEVALKMKWGRGKDYKELAPQQRWFACTETLAHLQSLRFRELVLCESMGNVLLFQYTGGEKT